MGIDGCHGEAVEAAADIAFFVYHGDHILTAGSNNYNLVGPDSEHGFFVTDIGSSLFPPSRSLLKGEFVEMGVPLISLGVAAVTLRNPGRMAGFTGHSLVTGIETGFFFRQVEGMFLAIYFTGQNKFPVFFSKVGNLFVAAGQARLS